MKKAYAIAILTTLMTFSVTAFAVPDEAQRQMTQRIQEQKMKLKDAENAQGAERDRLMIEHMTMMEETLKKMHAMNPQDGLSIKEHLEWIAEHQSLLDQIFEQMVDEQHLLMKEWRIRK